MTIHHHLIPQDGWQPPADQCWFCVRWPPYNHHTRLRVRTWYRLDGKWAGSRVIAYRDGTYRPVEPSP